MKNESIHWGYAALTERRRCNQKKTHTYPQPFHSYPSRIQNFSKKPRHQVLEIICQRNIKQILQKKKGKTAGFGNDKNFTADTRGV